MTNLTLSATLSSIYGTQAFLSALEAHSTLTLIFDLGVGNTVPAGYHVTEIKAVDHQTVDCGGVVNAWKETVIQLWRSNAETDDSYMTVGKFLKIYHLVAGKVPIDSQAEIKFEYGDDGAPAVNYQVSEISLEPSFVRVHLRWVGVRCKALDRRSLNLDSLEGMEMEMVAGCGSSGGSCGC
jgi:hypothetical protein